MITKLGVAVTLAGVLVGLTLGTSGAQAGTAVVFGDEVVSRMSEPDTNRAERDALAYCSARDRNCRVLANCPGGGFGYVIVARLSGFIESIGASCGKATGEAALAEAVRLCEQNAKKGKCQTEHAWMDQ